MENDNQGVNVPVKVGSGNGAGNPYDKPRTFGANNVENEEVKLETDIEVSAEEKSAENTEGDAPAAVITDATEESKPVDNAAAMDAALNAVSNPNIKPIEFKDTMAAKRQGTIEDAGAFNVINANGIISGQKVVNGTWRTIAIIMIILFIAALAVAGYLFYSFRNLEADNTKLSQESSSNSVKLEGIYGALGVTNQTDAISAINNEDVVLSNEEMNNLKATISGKYELSTVDFLREGTFLKRVGSYIVFSFHSGEEHAVMYMRRGGNWTLLTYSDTATHPCSGYTKLEQEIIGKALSCPED